MIYYNFPKGGRMRIASILLILNVLLFASVDKAQELYENTKYEEAIKQAKESKADYGDSRLHLVWAKSAEKLQRLDEAMSAYERVLILDENSIEARVALANIYSDTERYELASIMKIELSNYMLTPEQTKFIQNLKTAKIHFFKTSASLTFGHDSNINVSPGADILDDHFDTVGSVDELSTPFVKLLAKVSYINELEEKGGWSLRSNLKAFHQNNFARSSYNLSLVSIDGAIAYKKGRFSYSAPLNYDSVYYLERSLLTQYKFTPKATAIYFKRYMVSVNASYLKRGFTKKADSIRDDSAFGGGLSLLYIFDKNSFNINTNYELYKADKSDAPIYANKTLLTTSLGIKYTIWKSLIGKVNYKFRYGLYDDSVESVFESSNESRKDYFNQVEYKLSYTFNKYINVNISDKYIKNISNYVPAGYKKSVTTLGINISY